MRTSFLAFLCVNLPNWGTIGNKSCARHGIRDKKMVISISDALEVRDQLDGRFDSHDFINKYIALHENDYIEMLAQRNDKEQVFRALNAEIGRFLQLHQEELRIEKDIEEGKKPSQNIKGNVTNNQRWIKK